MLPDQFAKLSSREQAEIIVSDYIANGGPVDDATRLRWIEMELRRIQSDKACGRFIRPVGRQAGW